MGIAVIKKYNYDIFGYYAVDFQLFMRLFPFGICSWAE